MQPPAIYHFIQRYFNMYLHSDKYQYFYLTLLPLSHLTELTKSLNNHDQLSLIVSKMALHLAAIVWIRAPGRTPYCTWLTGLSISNCSFSSAPPPPPFKAIYLLKKLSHGSNGISYILALVGRFPVVSVNLFLCPLYF